MKEEGKPVSIFIGYSRKDKEHLQFLRSHLSPLERKELIKVWYDGLIEAGKEWETEIKRGLFNADMIIFLISSDFLHSEYCYSSEFREAIDLHEKVGTDIIPIIVRDCLWEETPFSKFQVLPPDGKPISNWSDIDAPYNIISKIIKKKASNEAYDINDIFNKSLKSEAINLQIEAATSNESRFPIQQKTSIARYFWLSFLTLSILAGGYYGYWKYSTNKYSKIETWNGGTYSLVQKKTNPYDRQEVGEFGIIDLFGRTVTPTIYQSISTLYPEGFAIVQKHNKFGLINAHGIEITKPIFDNINNIKEGRLIATKNSKFGVLDYEGKIVVEFIYDYLTDYYQGVSFARKGDKIGYIDLSGSEIIPVEMDEMFFIDPFERIASIKDENFKPGASNYDEVIDNIDKLMNNTQYQVYEETGLYKKSAKSHKQVEEYKFEEDETSIFNEYVRKINNTPFSYWVFMTEELACCRKGKKYFYYNLSGDVFTPPECDVAYPFRLGLAKISVNKKWGLIKTDMRYFVQPKYEGIFTHRNARALFITKINGMKRYGYIDAKGAVTIQPTFTDAGQFRDGLAGVCTTKNCGYIDTSGQTVIPFIYDAVGEFTEINQYETVTTVTIDTFDFNIDKSGTCKGYCLSDSILQMLYKTKKIEKTTLDYLIEKNK